MIHHATHQRRGFNLVEAAIVLGIVGLVIGGIWVAAANVQENLRISRAQQDVLSIISNLRSLFSTAPVVWGGPDPYDSRVNTALNSSVFPADSIQGTQVLNPWGKPYVANILILGSAADMQRTILLYVVVKDVATCSRLTTSFLAALRNEKDPQVIPMSDGGYSYNSDDPSDIIAACREAYDAVADDSTPLTVSISLGL